MMMMMMMVMMNNLAKLIMYHMYCDRCCVVSLEEERGGIGYLMTITGICLCTSVYIRLLSYDRLMLTLQQFPTLN
jgi:hypothetical protein